MQELWGANQVDHFDFSQKGKQEEGGASCSLLRKCGMKGSWELGAASGGHTQGGRTHCLC